MAETQPWYRLPYRQAIAYLKRKKPMTRAEFDEVELWAKNRAFTVAGVMKLNVLQSVLDELVEGARGGETIGEFRNRLEDIFEAAGIDPISPWHADTVFRTNVQAAYGRGLWEQAHDPDIANEIWGWRYHTVGDDRVRETHADLEGMVFQMGEADAFWPPWDYNCRCDAELITVAEAEDEGLTSSAPTREAQEDLLGSDFGSPAIAGDYEADLSKYHPTAVAAFYREVGRARSEAA